MQSVVIFGATGMVGQGAVLECLKDLQVKQVVTMNHFFSKASLSLLLVACFSSMGMEDRKTVVLRVPNILDAAALSDGSEGTPAVDPCRNFYQFACGRWVASTEIPRDKDRVMHQSTALVDQTDEKLNQLILRLAKQDPALVTKASKQIVDYYNSCLNFDKTVPAAENTLKRNLAEIDQITDRKQLTPLVAKLHRDGTNAFFAFGSGQDLKDSNSVIGFFEQGGMGLPEPSYYFDTDKKSKDIRKKYLAFISKMLTLTGQKKKTAEKNAKAIFSFETKLASKAMSFDQRQDPAKTNHPFTREALVKLVPQIDWESYFQNLSVPASALNVNEPEFFGHLNELLETTPLNDIKAYLAWQLANRSASEVSPVLDQLSFDFWSAYLHGEKQMKPRWKRCTRVIEHNLGYALAEVYVKTIDAQSIRARIELMITRLEEAFRNDLDTLSNAGGWLDNQTKSEAVKKLSKLKQKLGAPEKWRDYSSLQTGTESFYSNDLNVAQFEAKRDIAKIGQPLDRMEWDMMPWEVNAYYDPPKNEFVFPFGILQPPNIDLTASEGANYGAFGGATIGHEMTHGFDNDGRQYDSNGNVKDWWTSETKIKFEEKTKCFIDQANAYRVDSVGLNVDGKKTLPENLADQGGVKLGYAAYQVAKGRQGSGSLWLGKYNENQQYWIAYAQGWCEKARPETLREQIKSDPHPPAEFRVNGVILNRPEFARDFSCPEGSRMAPKIKCAIW